MARPLLGLLTTTVLVLASVVQPVAGVQTGPSPAIAPPEQRPTAVQNGSVAADGVTADRSSTVAPDTVLLYVDLYENGTARWRIEYRTRLDSPTEVATFRRFQRDLESGDAARNAQFHRRIRRTIESAENGSGREMTGENFRVRTTVRELPRTYGVVVYSFQWRGFAAVDGRTLRVGDALRGFFLGSSERLVISWPETYDLDAVEPTPDVRRESTVVWRGPTSFGSSGPRLRLARQPWTGSTFLPLGAAAVAVAGLAVIWAVRRRDEAVLSLAGRGPFEDETEESALLSNEERVVRLLRERGGRVKQQDVADELGWTDAKTSYVVSNLREEQRIRSFRMGRENVLSLADSLDPNHSEA